MAFPVILVNSATGSDTLASGAGPAVALTGAAGVTSADGLTVVLDGSPDLTNVATDGSHVIFMSDTTAGARNFCSITGKGDSGTPTAFVTVAQAFQGTNTDAWAIGGKRASLGATTSRKLANNNNGNGDMMPGWTLRFESGHTETFASVVTFFRNGDQTSGPIIIQGEPDAATMPVLTFSANDEGFRVDSNYRKIQYLDFRNTNATKTASDAVQIPTGNQGVVVDGCRINHATDSWFRGVTALGTANVSVIRCSIANTASNAVVLGNSAGSVVSLCRISDCGAGLLLEGANSDAITNNIIDNIVGDGITMSITTDAVLITGNIIHDCSGDGIKHTGAITTAPVWIVRNILASNGGYGINFSGATAPALASGRREIVFNGFYANTSGPYNPTVDFPSMDDILLTADPFIDAAGGDFNINQVAGGGQDLRDAVYTFPA